MKLIAYKSTVVIFLCLTCSFSRSSTTAFHPFYISVTEINHNAKTKSLEISCKTFAEDLEDVLKQNYKISIDLGNNKLQAQNNKVINDYILKHLSINLDSRTAALKFIGFEKENESVYCYFEVADVAAIKKITVTDTILQDYKQEQINIIHMIENGNRKSTKLDYPASQASFSF